MRIGVIGIGQMGGTLARRWSEAGHKVCIANSRGPDTARQFADDIGANAVDIHGAVESADVVLMSIPFHAVAKLPRDLFSRAARDLVIIDTGNYYPDVRDPRIAEIDAGMQESVWVSQQLGRPVIKAFNSILFHSLAELGKPEGSPARLAIAVAGDDARAKQIVMALVNETGFDPVDGGSLAQSWRQQPSTPAYCCDYDAANTRKGILAAVKGRAQKLRDFEWREGYGRLYASKPTHADAHANVIAMNRLLNQLNKNDRKEHMSKVYEGGCACGAIRYEISGEPIFQNDCQCRDCQGRSGTGHGSYLTFPSKEHVKITGEGKHWDIVGDSGNTKKHTFCPTCGSPVFLTFAAMPDLFTVHAASLDDPTRYKPQAVTYSVRGYAWDHLDPVLPKFDMMPPGPGQAGAG